MSTDEVEQIAHSLVFKVATYLWNAGIMVDIDHVKTNTKHVCIQKSELEEVFPPGTTVTVDLGKDVAKVFEADTPERAKAWTDNSPFRGVETNDLDYARDVLMMPQYIKAANRHPHHRRRHHRRRQRDDPLGARGRS
jgi:hypothetical protein